MNEIGSISSPVSTAAAAPQVPVNIFDCRLHAEAHPSVEKSNGAGQEARHKASNVGKIVHEGHQA